jgi:hypothetical protein
LSQRRNASISSCSNSITGSPSIGTPRGLNTVCPSNRRQQRLFFHLGKTIASEHIVHMHILPIKNAAVKVLPGKVSPGMLLEYFK